MEMEFMKEKDMNIIDKFRLDGKVAIVTGGSGLYGKQIVLALAEAGATVYTASRTLENNEMYASSLRKKGYKIYAETVDQGNEESIKNFYNRMIEKEKTIDILVNNSVLRIMKTYADTAEHFSESMNVNATGLFIITRIFGDYMAKQSSGSIINISSYMGELAPDDYLYKNLSFSGYSAPDYFFHKAGMNNLSRFMASYYGPSGVRSNSLCLGGLFNEQDELFVERYKNRTFLKRLANNTDIMGIIVFLASDASAYITGACIPVDGGYTAK